jgi:hypothetical protein
MPSDRPSKEHLILSLPEWRDMLREELVASGFEHDAAGVIARRVIERLVRRYLGGEHPLDRAA